MPAQDVARVAPLLLLMACADPAAIAPTRDSAEPHGDDTDSPVDSAPPGPGYLIVAAPALMDAAGRWADWRGGQGFETRVLATTDLVEDPTQTFALISAVQAELSAMWTDGEPLYLLLVGDAAAPDEGVTIGAFRCENDLNGCTTDNRYGDLDGDGVPEVAVGRVPAGSPEAVDRALARARAQEEERTVGDYNRRLLFWAGPTGFDAQLTQIVEGLVMQGLATVDPAYEILGVYADEASAYYDSPFEDRVISLLNDGASLSIYLGHGSSNESVGLSERAVQSLDQGTRAPFMALFACYNGLYAESEPSLAETLLALEQGPAAVLAAAGETHPYANGVLPYELQSSVLSQDVARVGDAVLAAKRGAFSPADGDEVRELLDLYARVEYGYSEEDLDRLLHQNIDLYNLMGDPALLLQRPAARLELELSGRWRDGGVSVHGAAPGIDSGLARVTFEVPRDVLLGEGSWEAAINTVVSDVLVEVVAGAFDATLDIDPSGLPGDTFYVKVYAWSDTTDAFGVAEAP